MKKLTIILFFTALCSAANCQQAEKIIKLNTPSQERGVNIMQAFQNRQSISSFQDKELSLQDLSDLVWAANGINRPDVGKRTAPSAQNSQDIDVYVALQQAVYIYDAKEHCLNMVNEGDYRGLAGDKVLPPCVLYIAADASRYRAGNNPEHVADMNRVDAGIVSQNISLFCAGTGLGTRPRARMKQAELREALKLTDTQSLWLNHPVGYPQ